MLTAIVPKPTWYKERGTNLIEEYRGGLECGGSRNSVIRALAESHGMSDEDVKQIMLDAGLKPCELPERMQEGFYDERFSPSVFAACGGESTSLQEGGKAAAAGVLPGMKGAKCRINGAPCNGCKPICDSVIVEDGESPWETRYLQKPFPPREDSGLIRKRTVLDKLREKCQGCDNYNRVRCRWCETGRAVRIVEEAENV